MSAEVLAFRRRQAQLRKSAPPLTEAQLHRIGAALGDTAHTRDLAAMVPPPASRPDKEANIVRWCPRRGRLLSPGLGDRVRYVASALVLIACGFVWFSLR